MIYVINERITAKINIEVIKMLYFIIVTSDIKFANPIALNISNRRNITPNPFEAPFTSALLKDIWEAIQIDRKKNA